MVLPVTTSCRYLRVKCPVVVNKVRNRYLRAAAGRGSLQPDFAACHSLRKQRESKSKSCSRETDHFQTSATRYCIFVFTTQWFTPHSFSFVCCRSIFLKEILVRFIWRNPCNILWSRGEQGIIFHPTRICSQHSREVIYQYYGKGGVYKSFNTSLILRNMFARDFSLFSKNSYLWSFANPASIPMQFLVFVALLLNVSLT
jgi:hypothetical protein